MAKKVGFSSSPTHVACALAVFAVLPFLAVNFSSFIDEKTSGAFTPAVVDELCKRNNNLTPHETYARQVAAKDDSLGPNAPGLFNVMKKYNLDILGRAFGVVAARFAEPITPDNRLDGLKGKDRNIIDNYHRELARKKIQCKRDVYALQ